MPKLPTSKFNIPIKLCHGKGPAYSRDGMWVECTYHKASTVVVCCIQVDYCGCQRGVHLEIKWLDHKGVYLLDGYSEPSMSPTKSMQCNVMAYADTFEQSITDGKAYVVKALEFVTTKIRQEITRLHKDLNKLENYR